MNAETAKGRSLSFEEADAMLRLTFEEIRNQHDTPQARSFIAAHWNRYVRILESLPPLRAGAPVLEIGASILSSALKRRLGADVHTAYHELEVEWAKRFAAEGIKGTPLELMRDPLPYPDGTFELILFDEVMEHFPLSPEFFLRQIFRVLSPTGQVVLAVPNFATWEHRMALLRGRNPQDRMDPKYIYYAHHREPVMSECLEWIARCGGRVVESRWTDYAPPASGARTAWNLLRYLRHLEFHRLAHAIFPPMRSYLYVRAVRAVQTDGAGFPAGEMAPPMASTREFAGRFTEASSGTSAPRD